MLKFTLGSASIDTQRITRALSAAAPEIVRDAAQVFIEQAQAIVPVDTGLLQSNIQGEVTAAGPFYNEMRVSPAIDAANKWGFSPAYARRIEFGFVGLDSLGRYYNQAPRPYMRPAWDLGQQPALEKASDLLRAAIAGS